MFACSSPFSRSIQRFDWRFTGRAGLRVRLGAALVLALALVAPGAVAQNRLMLSYSSFSTNLETDLPDQGFDGRDFVSLGYQVALPRGFTLTPTFGLVAAEGSTLLLGDSDGFTLGVWGQYDLLTYRLGNAYAQGGVAYLDYELGSEFGDDRRSELQFSLGVGTGLALTDTLNAYTSLSYVFVDGSQAEAAYDGRGAGLELGVELSF